MYDFIEKLPHVEGLPNIYFHVSENSGVGLYRQFLWAESLQDQKLANILISDFRWGLGEHKNPTDDEMFAIANWADVIIVGRLDKGDWLSKWGGIKEFFNMPMIMDTDDNIEHVRPTNPGYQGYHPGSEATYWNRIALAKVFDALTVSTQNLKDFHKKDIPKIFVLPNSLNFKYWKFNKRTKKDDTIRIIFNGSGSHKESMDIIVKPLEKIMKNYPQVVFICPKLFRPSFKDWDKKQVKRVEFIDWFPLRHFPKKMAQLKVDIGLAPLADNMFNRAKSNLRWLEYSALKIPVICSPVEAYKNVVHGETGLVALERVEWYNSLEQLIKDKPLRLKLARNAYKEVFVKFNIKKNAEKALTIYKEVIDKYHKFFGDKKKFSYWNYNQKTKEHRWREIKN